MARFQTKARKRGPKEKGVIVQVHRPVTLRMPEDLLKDIDEIMEEYPRAYSRHAFMIDCLAEKTKELKKRSAQPKPRKRGPKEMGVLVQVHRPVTLRVPEDLLDDIDEIMEGFPRSYSRHAFMIDCLAKAAAEQNKKKKTKKKKASS